MSAKKGWGWPAASISERSSPSRIGTPKSSGVATRPMRNAGATAIDTGRRGAMAFTSPAKLCLPLGPTVRDWPPPRSESSRGQSHAQRTEKGNQPQQADDTAARPRRRPVPELHRVDPGIHRHPAKQVVDAVDARRLTVDGRLPSGIAEVTQHQLGTP